MDRNIAVADQAIAQEKAIVANELAHKHFEVEPGLRRVFRCSGEAQLELQRTEPIKLLEVNQDTVPSGALPLHFGPSPVSGIPYPSIIMEVTPEEFARIESHDLALPGGWKFEDELMKPTETGAD
jgi:hypothetical protein